MQGIIVTGCDSGFGKDLIELLDKDGKYVLFATCLTDQGMEDLKKKCSANVFPFKCDVTRKDSIDRFKQFVLKTVEEKKVPLFGLVNNAGVLIDPGPTEWCEVSSLEIMLNVNVIGVAMMVKTFLPQIRASRGRIVNVASIAGRVGLPAHAYYSASKYAVLGYTDVLRREMVKFGVNVSTIEPGVFAQTGLYQRFTKGLDGIWNRLDASIKQDYGEPIYKTTRDGLAFALKGMTNSNPNLVSEAMYHALTSSKPQRRYRVGKDSYLAMAVIEKLPDAIQDVVMGAKQSKVLPASSNAQIERAAWDKYADDSFVFKIVGGAITVGAVYSGYKGIRSLL